MSVRDEVCFCPCHNEDSGLLHCIPCCATCRKCGLRILNHAYKQHAQECKGLSLCTEGQRDGD